MGSIQTSKAYYRYHICTFIIRILNRLLLQRGLVSTRNVLVNSIGCMSFCIVMGRVGCPVCRDGHRNYFLKPINCPHQSRNYLSFLYDM